MKDPIRFVRKAIITALTGNISYGGSIVPIYGRVPSNATYPFVRVYSLSSGETNQNRDSFNSEVITRIEVVTRFQSDNGGELQCNAIVSDCLELVRTRSAGYFDLASDGFNVYTSENEGIQYIEQDLSDHTYFRAIIELSNKIQQLQQIPPVTLEGFIFDVDTTQAGGSNSTQYQLPLSGAGTTNIEVNWGDGNTDTITSTSASEKLHTYSSGGIYTITITGTLQTFLVNNHADRLKLKEIKNWGNGNGLTLASVNGSFFMGAGNMTCTATDQPQVTTANFQQIFRSSTSIVSGVGSFDVSGVTSLSFGFYQANNFNEDLSNWDVSGVTAFQYCFERCFALDQSFAAWDMTSATNVDRMFKSSTLSTANYDATLIGWAAQSLNSGLTFNGGNSTYTAGGAAETARNTLINTYGWTIVDGGTA